MLYRAHCVFTQKADCGLEVGMKACPGSAPAVTTCRGRRRSRIGHEGSVGLQCLHVASLTRGLRPGGVGGLGLEPHCEPVTGRTQLPQEGSICLGRAVVRPRAVRGRDQQPRAVLSTREFLAFKPFKGPGDRAQGPPQ